MPDQTSAPKPVKPSLKHRALGRDGLGVGVERVVSTFRFSFEEYAVLVKAMHILDQPLQRFARRHLVEAATKVIEQAEKAEKANEKRNRPKRA